MMDFHQSHARVFKLICTRGPVSRAQLADYLGLSRPSLTQITKALLRNNLIIEAGRGNSSKAGGRREILLTVAPDAGFILCGQLERDFMRIGVSSLN